MVSLSVNTLAKIGREFVIIGDDGKEKEARVALSLHEQDALLVSHSGEIIAEGEQHVRLT